jgi:diguanylate cyclase (GGDEF)-like protein
MSDSLEPVVASLRQQLIDKEDELQLLRDQIAELIRHDALTGVMNRRTLIEMLNAELQRSHRTGHPFCFAIIDLDKFNNIKQQFGNDVGDTVLKTVSDASIKLLRVLDRFGRLGDEEFGIVLPATWLDSGVIAITRLRAAVSACDWATITPGTAVSFSAGLTTNATGDTAEKVIERAAKALGQAREKGGNCTITLEDALPDMPPFDD